MTSAHVVSVQVGAVRELGTTGAANRMDRPWSTGIFKEPIVGRRLVTPLGLDGDEQADKVDHGGPDKALLAYGADNLATWADVLGEVPPGGFGENLTIRGLDESTVCIGDRFRIGDALVECSQPRQPCWKLDRRWRQRDLSARVIETGRSGWYLRVLEPGEVGAGDDVELVDRPNPDWSVARAARIMHRMERDPRAAGQLAALPQLSIERVARHADRPIAMRRALPRFVAALISVSVVVGACTDTDTPELSGDQANDPELVTGRDIYQAECARCHGGSGGGGAGPKLSDGRAVDRFPNPSDQEQVVHDGRGSMPAWGSKLSDDEIAAVVRYTREAL